LSAHAAVERHEQHAHALHLGAHGRRAAAVVAVLAGFLAGSEMLANTYVKKVITGETRVADLTARRATNEVKIVVTRDRSIVAGLEARDRELDADIAKRVDKRDHAEVAHLKAEIATVLLQVGIVLASVSVLVAAAWMLWLGLGLGVVGIVVALLALL
jgi:ribose 1,5-bisphosphokinase PhnN